MDEGAIDELIGSRGRRGLTIWEDFENDRHPQRLAKPGDIAFLSQYRDIIAIMNIWRP